MQLTCNEIHVVSLCCANAVQHSTFCNSCASKHQYNSKHAVVPVCGDVLQDSASCNAAISCRAVQHSTTHAPIQHNKHRAGVACLLTLHRTLVAWLIVFIHKGAAYQTSLVMGGSRTKLYSTIVLAPIARFFRRCQKLCSKQATIHQPTNH